MADDTLQNATDKIATDELSTLNGVDVSGASPRIKVQRLKNQYGADGSATDVDTSHGLPLQAEVAGTLTESRVSASTTSATLLSANANRRSAIVVNESDYDLFIRYSSSAASITAYTYRVRAQSTWEMPAFPRWTGQINCIWDTAYVSVSGAAQVTEVPV